MIKDESQFPSNSSLDVSSEGPLTLKVDADDLNQQAHEPYQRASCMVKEVFPVPKVFDLRGMLMFVRACLHSMFSMPKLVNLTNRAKQVTLCDLLFTIAAKFGNDDDEVGTIIPDGTPSLEAKITVPWSFLPKQEMQDRYIKWLLVLTVEAEKYEHKYLDVLEPYLCRIFRALSGRCFCISNVVNELSEDLGGLEGNWKSWGTALFGIGSEDLVSGDAMLRVAGRWEGLFLRPQASGIHSIIGDGFLAVLGPENHGKELISFPTVLKIS